MSILDRVKTWAAKNIAVVFGILRCIKPNLLLKDFGLVTRFDDVQEVLSRPDVFGITYAEKMSVITNGSNFFLGMNDTPTYTRDVSNMRLVVRRGDIENLVAPMVEKLAGEIMAGGDEEMDLVQELTRIVPARFTAGYIGIPGPDEQQLIDWTTTMFQYLFFPGNPPEVDRKAEAYAESTRNHIDSLIAARRGQPPQGDDVMARCLDLQQSNTPGMSDTDIRNNLIGIIIGLIPTTSKCAALTLDYLLDNPELLAGALAAAQRDDNETLRKYVLESLRFNSFGAGVFRETLEDYTVASGTLRRKRFPKGSQVLVATQSAMLDGRQLKKPKRFSLERPDYHYMHFGYGMHTCFGQYINMVQIPIIVKAALKRPGLRRAPGEAGKTRYDGPFPSHLQVQFSSTHR